MHGLRIEVGERATVAISLRVGQIKTAITMLPPTATQLEAESKCKRNFLQLALLAAPAIDISPASNLFTSNVGPPARTIVLPGTLPSSTVYSLDGMNIAGSRDGELAVSPSVAAIDQFRVQETFLMPDQGIGSATVNIAKKREQAISR